MSKQENDLNALSRAIFSPETVALVGVSDDPSKTSGRPLRFLRQAGYRGQVFNVNPGRQTVQGERAYPSLSDLPVRPDHVFVVTGADQAIATVSECGRLGVTVATVLASGFAESGAAGMRRELELRELTKRYPVRVLGPSSIGLANLHHGLVLTANAAFAEPDLKAGGTFLASQSGSLIGALLSRGSSREFAFHSLVSVGAELDLSIGEICHGTLDDPSVESYVLFLESMRHSDALRAFAEGAAARGKPVLAYKLGRSPVGAELAVSHTGSLAGDDDIADEFLRACGIVRVETFESLLEATPLLKKVQRYRAGCAVKRRANVGVVTTTGGGAAMPVDQLGLRGVNVAAPSAETLKRLANAGVSVAPGRIVDLTLAGTRYEIMKAALDVMLDAPEFDIVLATIGSSARFDPQLAVKPVLDCASSPKPLACFVVPEAPEALASLALSGVPNFRTPESCADSIAAALRWMPPQAKSPSARLSGAGRKLLTEAEAYDIFASVGVSHAPYRVVSVEDAAACEVHEPVAVKLLSAEIAHKTDVGGVVLGVNTQDDLGRAIKRIQDSVRAAQPDLACKQFLVQTMKKGLAEALLGFRRDPEMGPVVVLAAGGVFAEIYRDRSLRLAPVNLESARSMIDEVRGLRLVGGYRGLPKGDLDALSAAIVAVSNLAAYGDAEIVEAEINPMMIMPEGQGVVAVDAVVWVSQPAQSRKSSGDTHD